MKHFAQLFKALDQTTKTNQKVEALEHYFNTADKDDKLWTIALLSHKRPKRIISTSYLKQWAATLANIPDWLFDESYHVVGDLAETISLLIKQEGQADLSIAAWINQLEALRKAPVEEIQVFIIDAWKKLDSVERFLFNKLITGGFRIGVSQKLMVRALSRSTGIEEDELAHRIIGNWDPFNITFDELIADNGTSFDDARPYPFFLAYALENADKELGTISNWFAEYKWDGIRGQIVKRNNEVSIWSRGEELVTEKFPELVIAASVLPNGSVLDGEIVPWKDDKVQDFQLLQTRLGRKTVSKKLLEDVPVSFIAYDLLELDYQDIRQMPLHNRKEQLEKLIQSTEHDRIMLSSLYHETELSVLNTLKLSAREIGAEGLMLKHKDSTYEVGRKKGGWYKWKLDPYVIDAVLTYGMRGHGRRANLYTDYTFGLWNKGELVTFAKAYSGLTDAEFRQVDAFIKKNTIEKFGPVRQVKPELVFELAFEGIALSKRHKSGVAVRFPRIHRWRKDKKPEDANSLTDLKALKNLDDGS